MKTAAAPARAGSSGMSAGALAAAGRLQRQCSSCGQHRIAGGECEDCQRKRSAPQQESRGGNGGTAPAAGGITASGGQPLEPGLRTRMEHRFDHDFSGVRVHTDDSAAKSADTLRARAYTVGRTIVFARGAFAPHSQAGQGLIAHELAHVVQNERSPRTGPRSKPVSEQDDASEREAQAAAHATGGGSVRIAAAPAALIQRAPSNTAETAFTIGAIALGTAAAAGLVAWAAGAFDQKPNSEPQEPSPLDDPGFRKRWEAGLEEGLRKLESANPKGCGFPEGEGMAYDQENWTVVTEGEWGKLDGWGFRAKSADAYRAAELLFTRLDRWNCDCRLFGEIALLHAWWRALENDKAQFNKRFAGLTLSAEKTTGVKRRKVESELETGLDDATWESAPVGSKMVWKNHSPFAKGAWANEHAIKRSMAKSGQPSTYAAQGVVTKVGTGATKRDVLNATEEQVKLEMAKNSIDDYPVTFEITDDSIDSLTKAGIDAKIIKTVQSIKNIKFIGRHKLLEHSVITEINDKIPIQTTADNPNPRINNTVKAIVNSTKMTKPEPKDPLVANYIKDNIKRHKIEIPT